jgi:membrane-associated phospholipid phosphatase
MATTDTEERSGWSYACLAISLLLFFSVTLGVVFGVTNGLDASVRTAVNAWASPGLTSFFESLTHLGSTAVVYVLTVLISAALWFSGRRPAALHLAVVMLAAAIVNNAVKLSIARVRPEAFFGDLPASYSFASGHALFAGCLYGVLGGMLAAAATRGWQRTAILACSLALIGGIGLSRVYLGVHYPTDVIAGFALAAMIVCVTRGVLSR